MSFLRFMPSCAVPAALFAASPAFGQAPPTEGIEVQRPANPSPPILPPAPGEPASEVPPSPAELPSEAPEPLGAPDDAGATAETEVASARSTSEPSLAPSPTPAVPMPAIDLEPAGGADRWKQDYVRVERPRFRGLGMMVTAGSLYATALMFQLGDLTLCGNCASGLLERAFLGSAVILAPIGARMRARSDAYHDAATRRPFRETRGMVIGGVTLAAVGAAAGIANEVMWWKCMRGGTGPYHLGDGGDDDWMWTECRYGAGRLTLNLSAAAVAAGLSMAVWGLRYRRDTETYRHARVTVAPHVTTHEAMLTVAGRF